MAVNTYFGSGKMTKIYLGSTEITKIYHYTDLVYTSIVVPAISVSYINFDINLQVLPKNNDNVYVKHNQDLQLMKPIE